MKRWLVADIIFYVKTLHDDVCTRMHARVKLLASYIASLATVAKQSLGILNSAQCIHQLLSILLCL